MLNHQRVYYPVDPSLSVKNCPSTAGHGTMTILAMVPPLFVEFPHVICHVKVPKVLARIYGLLFSKIDGSKGF